MQDGAGHDDGTAAEDVGQPAGGQLERDDHATPCTVNSRPISARERPRACASSTVIGVVRPTGSQRSAVSPTSRRVAERTVSARS